MPVRKGRLTSQPETALAVGHDRIDRGNRYSLRFAKAFHPAGGHVAYRFGNPILAPYDPQRAISVCARVAGVGEERVQVEMRSDNSTLEADDAVRSQCP